MSSFSFHRSDFGGDLPISDQLKFHKTSGSVCGTTSVMQQCRTSKLENTPTELPRENRGPGDESARGAVDNGGPYRNLIPIPIFISPINKIDIASKCTISFDSIRISMSKL